MSSNATLIYSPMISTQPTSSTPAAEALAPFRISARCSRCQGRGHAFAACDTACCFKLNTCSRCGGTGVIAELHLPDSPLYTASRDAGKVQ